jgi:hypothetical protein
MQYKVDPTIIAEAVALGQSVVKRSAQKLRHNDISAINKFIMKANSGRTRVKITMQECEKIVNIAKAYS